MNPDYIRENKYGKYYIPDNQLHRPVAATVANGQVWEAETIKYIIKRLNNKSVVTAGAYFGDFLPALSRATTGTVYAFEPVPDLFDYSQKTIKLNSLNNVLLCNKALSCSSGQLSMQLYGGDGTTLLGGMSRIASRSNSTIEVESVSLDSFIPPTEKISVLHLDIEEHEGKALEGSIELIKNNLPTIISEGPPSSFFENHVPSLGYQFVKNVQGNHVWEPPSLIS